MSSFQSVGCYMTIMTSSSAKSMIIFITLILALAMAR